MITREPLWPLLALILGGVLLMASVARAGPRGPVYIPPILHQDSQQPDKLLSKAFRTAVALRVPVTADWRLTQPDPAVCRAGCVVVRIAGRRAPSPQYVVKLLRFPRGGQLSSTQIAGPSDTTPSLLADALLLKTSFLLRRSLIALPATPRPVITRRVSPSPPPAKPRSNPRFEVGIGPTALVGVGASFLFAGVEMAASLRLYGPLTLRVGAGIVGNGEGPDYYARFVALPVHLMVGAQWSWRWFQLGLFAGGSAMALWAQFDPSILGLDNPAEMKGLCGGPSAEVRIALRVHRHVSLGVSARATYVLNRLSTEVVGSFETAHFTMPEALIQTSLDLTIVF